MTWSLYRLFFKFRFKGGKKFTLIKGARKVQSCHDINSVLSLPSCHFRGRMKYLRYFGVDKVKLHKSNLNFNDRRFKTFKIGFATYNPLTIVFQYSRYNLLLLPLNT